LPSIIPSYVYSLFASLIVGAIIVSSCGLSIASVKQHAEEQQLSTIANYVASESMQLISSNSNDNLISTVLLDLPSLIGGQRYWIHLANDSSRAWVEIGFGAVIELTGRRAEIPADIFAYGFYVSGSGQIWLRSYCNDNGVHLTVEGDY